MRRAKFQGRQLGFSDLQKDPQEADKVCLFSRDSEQAVDCIYGVRPPDDKHTFLGAILNNVPNANSFQSIQTVDNIVYATFT